MVAVILLAFSGLYTYWHWFDRAPPMTDITAKLIEYNDAKHYIVVEWSAFKTRSCYGKRRQTITETGDEPPPRVSIALPSEEFTGTDYPSGQRNTWRRMIQVPQDHPYPFLYKAAWAFTCNSTQTDNAVIVIKSPPVTVGQE